MVRIGVDKWFAVSMCLASQKVCKKACPGVGLRLPVTLSRTDGVPCLSNGRWEKITRDTRTLFRARKDSQCLLIHVGYGMLRIEKYKFIANAAGTHSNVHLRPLDLCT
jgi:hypothetical protein